MIDVKTVNLSTYRGYTTFDHNIVWEIVEGHGSSSLKWTIDSAVDHHFRLSIQKVTNEGHISTLGYSSSFALTKQEASEYIFKVDQYDNIIFTLVVNGSTYVYCVTL